MKYTIATEETARLLARDIGPELVVGQEMAPFTSYKTGGKAAFFLKATDSRQVSRAMTAAQNHDIAVFLLGGGTNILVSDEGFPGLVIRVAVTGIDLVGTDQVHCGAGEELETLVDFARDHSLAGLEFAAGIVGSVGGAIYGNAGAYGGEICNVIHQMEVVKPDGVIGLVAPQFGEFSYRDSAFKRNKAVLISADFQLRPGDKAQIAARVEEIRQVRRTKLPYELPSAGCFFKNIPDETQEHGKLAAGKLLEEVGAKEMSVGGAAVSQKHANIIVNNGTATSKDIRELADKLKVKVYEKFGIMLEEEVIQVGDI